MKRPYGSAIVLAVILTAALWALGIDENPPVSPDYALRRGILMDFMGGGIAVMKNTEPSQQNFYYLTGFDEPGAALLLIPGEEKKFILFVQPSNAARAVWTGEVAGLEGAKTVFHADEAYPIDMFEQVLSRSLRGKEKVFCSFLDTDLSSSLIQMIRRPYSDSPKVIADLTEQIHEMRVIKSPYEISLLQEAADITCLAVQEVLKTTEAGMNEAEIEATIEYVFRKNGAAGPGFPSIVGSGPNSTILHYEVNNRQTDDGDLVLMDIGAEVGHYTADVTRTIPVSGRFSAEQKDIYDLVLEAMGKAIDRIAPGVEINQVHDTALSAIAEGLLRLDLITDAQSPWQTRVWLMYNIDHWIGLDVHDVGDYRRRRDSSRPLEPGMVLTVEPGLYIRMESLDNIRQIVGSSVSDAELDKFVQAVRPAVQKYLNIGVRIEDDVLVTEKGHRNLSEKAPKKIDEIETIMNKKEVSRDH